MDPDVYKVIKSVYGVIQGKEEATLDDKEIAFISGQLETLLQLFSTPESDLVEPKRKGWFQ